MLTREWWRLYSKSDSDEVQAHNDWVNMLGVVPVIRALREKAMTIQSETMDSIDRKLPDLE